MLALGLAHSGLRGIVRTFLTMWVHEIGHAVTAWLCGFGAFPGPWLTPISENRIALVSLAIAALLIYAGYRAWTAEANWICVALGGVLFVQAVLTLGLRAHPARALILFMGDGGSLLLGTGLMATIYVAPGSVLHRGWLRWGFLVIGACAFMDAFTTWWEAKHSVEGIVFGENVGVRESDPTRLVFEFGWTEAKVISRYLTLAWTCLLVLASVYAINLRRPPAAPPDAR